MALVVAGVIFLLLPASAALNTGLSKGPAATFTPARPTAPTPAAPPEPTPSAAEPRRLSIGTLDLTADIVTIGTDADGVLVPPTNPAHVGWFTESSKPGELGRAVLVGHLDSRDGPAVFAGLSQLRSGDMVSIEAADGAVHSFAVTSVTSHRKDEFPTDDVYGATPDAELRLITCGGSYRKSFGYIDNVIVAAARVS
jgi:Sortase domain